LRLGQGTAWSPRVAPIADVRRTRYGSLDQLGSLASVRSRDNRFAVWHVNVCVRRVCFASLDVSKLGYLPVAVGLAIGLIISFASAPPRSLFPRPAIPPKSAITAAKVHPPWRGDSAVPANALVDVSFPNAGSGFGVIGSGYEPDGGSPTQLVRSSDGGTTWHAMAGFLPYANRRLPSGEIVFLRLAFATTSFGYSWDQAQIDFTTDGGAHWRVLPELLVPYRHRKSKIRKSRGWPRSSSRSCRLHPRPHLARGIRPTHWSWEPHTSGYNSPDRCR
jgi:hypothetical protein